MDDRFNRVNDRPERDGDEEFFERLRSGEKVNDTNIDNIAASFFESETAREPNGGDDADLTLWGSKGAPSDTTVFQKSGKSGGKSGPGKSSPGKSGAGKKKGKVAIFFQHALRVLIYICCLLAIVFCVLTLAVAMYLGKVTAGDDQLLDLNSLELGLSTRIMVKDPETGEYYEYDRIFGEENRVWVPYEEFPKELIDTLVASEDKRFWDHKGVDIRRTVMAFINEYVYRRFDQTQGGSTLTQQLIKNITKDDAVEGESGVLRKIREIYRAYQLERRFSKEQILEAYLNTFRLGGQIAGIEAGARYYFDVETKDLTTAQSAAIISITNWPSQYDPFINAEENQRRREGVAIWELYDQGYLDEAGYNAALAESASFVFDQPHLTTVNTVGHVSSYYTDMVINEVMNDLQTLNGLSFDEAYDLVYNGGLRIYTVMDPEIQAVVERVALDQPENPRNTIFPSRRYIETEAELEEERILQGNPDLEIGDLMFNQIQAAIVVMNYEGEVLGVAGGIGEKTVSLGTNRAIDSTRGAGSAIKPISVYGPAIELNIVHYSSVFADAPVSVVNGQPWPRNYDNTYGSPVTVYDGVRVSLNTTAAMVLNLLTYDVAYDYLQSSLGITTLVDNRLSAEGTVQTDRAPAPMATGSLTDGIKPVELTAAFATFGNDGTYTPPHSYHYVVDSHNEYIIDRRESLMRNQAFSPETAMIMNKMLQGVVSGGTGTAARPTGYSNDLPYGGKSGTTSDNYDLWFVGFNPYYVCTVWMGYDIPKRMSNYYPRPTQVAFKAVMGEISADLPYMNFPSVDTVRLGKFCRATGLWASPECPSTATGYYKDGFMPSATCNHALAPPPKEPEDA